MSGRRFVMSGRPSWGCGHPNGHIGKAVKGWLWWWWRAVTCCNTQGLFKRQSGTSTTHFRGVGFAHPWGMSPPLRTRARSSPGCHRHFPVDRTRKASYAWAPTPHGAYTCPRGWVRRAACLELVVCTAAAVQLFFMLQCSCFFCRLNKYACKLYSKQTPGLPLVPRGAARQ